VWLGANIGIVGIVYGAILTTVGLSLWPGAAAVVVGTILSFVLVGVLGVAGKWGGAPMLGLSRVPFGRKGNLAPTLVSWISLLGWEAVTAVIAAYALPTLLSTAWHVPPKKTWMLVSLLGVATAALLLGRLGPAHRETAAKLGKVQGKSLVGVSHIGVACDVLEQPIFRTRRQCADEFARAYPQVLPVGAAQGPKVGHRGAGGDLQDHAIPGSRSNRWRYR
jgi:hypothetical protein